MYLFIGSFSQMGDLSDFKKLIQSYDIAQLRSCQQLINDTICGYRSNLDISSSSVVSVKPCAKDINDFVEYHQDFIDTTEHGLLAAEIQSLGFNFKTCSDAVQNKFVSSLSDPYTWSSKKGKVINNPLDMANFPVIKSLMDKVNQRFGCKMNCVLATCYVNGRVNVRLHDDAEHELDPSQPICVMSIGATRRVEFVDKDKKHKYAADKVLDPSDSSIYIMKAGCQEGFLHRVRRDVRVQNYRICLSFRCFIEPSTAPVVATPAVSATSATPPPPSSTPARPPRPISGTNHAAQGFSPFHSDISLTHGHSSLNDGRERVCLILGSSITTRVDGDMMSRKSRKVINLSESGAKIQDLSKIVNEFYADNPLLNHKVDKIVINIGTNDVKWLNGRKYSVFRKFRAPLSNLIRDLQFLFPHAQIVFTTVLPIRALYNYTATTINDFNRLIFEVCNSFGCIFYDCFYEFLAPDLKDYDCTLFRDKWHLNDLGLRTLCRALKHCVYGSLFCSAARTSCCPSFYNFH